ncbi:MAG: hypothetical protein A3F84_14080 [Candidatus Handelsmanbacteria bacterium RIFCSPLOWO2_12_FULL_64_10]|uniref:GxxExxY protein n=1 Tax=Handelsmanbacteria sp. (strain RIFCSPLOWO2_12_FULL_64_10) TaxID=1817868 RepID=A0A1F6C9V3_HANXR|nr:MAG: hypothetical protein A3F84_14080 [Candidatus Handelsmanbacteria bacterium RIFCSPLOWO2_12_FULL_64_10]
MEAPDDKRDPRTYAIIEAAMEVHGIMGCAYLDRVHQEALEIEFKMRDLPHVREKPFEIYYKEQQLSRVYRPDFICFKFVVVDVKALARLGPIEEAQMINYLKTTACEIGLVLNFGTPSLQYRRFVLSKERHS